jgi:hypothetical protein
MKQFRFVVVSALTILVFWHSVTKPLFGGSVFNPPPFGKMGLGLLSIGVRDYPSLMGGDTGATRVYNAFNDLPYNQFTTNNDSYRSQASSLALNTIVNGGINKLAIQTAINNAASTFSDANNPQNNLFIFYVNSHGDNQLSGNQQTALQLEHTDSSANLNSTELAAMFSGGNWDQVTKLFIMDTCYAGGFWTDPGGLSSLSHAAVLAAAPKSEVSYASYDENPIDGYTTGILGQRVMAALSGPPLTPAGDPLLSLPIEFLQYDSEVDYPTTAGYYGDTLIQAVLALAAGSHFQGLGRLQHGDWNVDFSLADVDMQLFSAESADFFAPEPSTSVLASIAAIVLLTSRLRRRADPPPIFGPQVMRISVGV